MHVEEDTERIARAIIDLHLENEAGFRSIIENERTARSAAVTLAMGYKKKADALSLLLRTTAGGVAVLALIFGIAAVG